MNSPTLPELENIEIDEFEWLMLMAELAFLNPWFYEKGGNC